MPKILLLEDDRDLAGVVQQALEVEHFTVQAVHSGEEAMEYIGYAKYDVMVFDWELPGLQGVEVLEKIRAEGNGTPIIMLTGKNALDDKEKGFDVGADDYLTKPFEMAELIMRIRALLRRGGVSASKTLKIAHVSLDLTNYRVFKGEQEVHLRPREFSLLEFLMRHPGETFSSEALISRVWKDDAVASDEAVRMAIRRIRQAIDLTSGGTDRSLIENIPRIGYRLRSN